MSFKYSDLYSSILINSTLQSHGFNLANSFHDGLIFKRLKAMRQQATKVSNWKLGLLTTLCAILFVTFACSEEKSESSEVKTSHSKSQPADEVVSVEEIFKVVEEQPSYDGGMDAFYKYVMSEMRYPKAARTSGIEGTVEVQFVIERDGSVSKVKALNSIGGGCDEEAVRVIKEASGFKAGSQRKRTVRTAMVMPVTFKLNSKKNPDNTVQGSMIMGKLDIIKSKLNIEANYENGTWSGIVRTPEGDELPGVNIIVAGTHDGTVSDLDGTFSVKAEKHKELHVSFVGYQSAVLK